MCWDEGTPQPSAPGQHYEKPPIPSCELSASGSGAVLRSHRRSEPSGRRHPKSLAPSLDSSSELLRGIALAFLRKQDSSSDFRAYGQIQCEENARLQSCGHKPKRAKAIPSSPASLREEDQVSPTRSAFWLRPKEASCR